MANTTGHTVRRYFGHKLYLANIAAIKAAPLADHGLEIDVLPFWTACPPRGCDCAECAISDWDSYSDSWSHPRDIREMDLMDYEAELADYRRDQACYLMDLMCDDQLGDRYAAEASALVIEAWLAGAAM